MRAYLWSLIALAVFFAPSLSGANDAPIRIKGGGASLNSPHPTIRMHSEEVAIRLHKDSYTVEAVFHFFNSGETTTEWVGFPKRALGYLSFEPQDFIRFETWVDGKKTTFLEEPVPFRGVRNFLDALVSQSGVLTDYRWLVKRVTFPAHATTTTRVRYEAAYHRLSDAKIAYYIYGTGAYCKGTIGNAVFEVDGSDVGGIRHFKVMIDRSAKRTTILENLLRYELKNFKPALNAEMEVHCDR